MAPRVIECMSHNIPFATHIPIQIAPVLAPCNMYECEPLKSLERLRVESMMTSLQRMPLKCVL